MKLTKEQIAFLENRGCTAENWAKVTVANEESLAYISDVTFLGKVSVGSLDGTITYGGLKVHCALRRVTLKDVSIKTGCYICDVYQGIVNYKIGKGCYISNVGCMECTGTTTFGNGTRVAVLCETGGREVIIHRNTNAQDAYAQAFLVFNDFYIKDTRNSYEHIVSTNASEFGILSDYCVVVNTQTLIDVYLDAGTRVEGARLLQNCGCYGTSIEIGAGVRMEDAIAVNKAKVGNGVSLTRCFVGEATVISNGFTATDCVFCSNCHLENGEACSILAGPYTVSHHKSTLLIGCNFSFYNAGSGTNQSNHAYKSGPIHQGVLLRGCKTASSSHVLLPVKAGAYSMIMGHHKAHFDTTMFPFSYILEENGEEYLVPGAVATTIGLYRDRLKWPKRDKREAFKKGTPDRIDFAMFTPYTLDPMVDALMYLKKAISKRDSDRTYKGLRLTDRACKKGIEVYSSILFLYLARLLRMRYPEGIGNLSDEQLKERMCEIPETPIVFSEYYGGKTEWTIQFNQNAYKMVDFGGCYVDKAKFEKWYFLMCNSYDLLAEVPDYFDAYMRDLSGKFLISNCLTFEYAWNWAFKKGLFRNWSKQTLLQLDSEVDRYFNNLKDKIIADGMKEFDGPSYLVGYGSLSFMGPEDGFWDATKDEFNNVQTIAGNRQFVDWLKDVKSFDELDPQDWFN